jgi:hypothetical protein
LLLLFQLCELTQILQNFCGRIDLQNLGQRLEQEMKTKLTPSRKESGFCFETAAVISVFCYERENRVGEFEANLP